MLRVCGTLRYGATLRHASLSSAVRATATYASSRPTHFHEQSWNQARFGWAPYWRVAALAGTATAAAAACSRTTAAADAGFVPEGLQEVSDEVKEPETGAVYPRVLSEDEELISVGVRLMTPLKVQVYCIGLYIDKRIGSLVLSRWIDSAAEKLLDDPSFWKKLASPESIMPRAIRMHVVREVSGKHMQNGFDRGLVPRVKHAAKHMDLPGGKNALRKFNGAFRDAGILKEGAEIVIRMSGQGKLRLSIQGRADVELDNPALVWAIMDMFFGEKSVAPNVKAGVADGFAEFLKVA